MGFVLADVVAKVSPYLASRHGAPFLKRTFDFSKEIVDFCHTSDCARICGANHAVTHHHRYSECDNEIKKNLTYGCCNAGIQICESLISLSSFGGVAMGLLDGTALAALHVDRMIFHVVGPSEDDLILMDEVVVTGLEDFFLQRIRETNIGNRFEFIGPDQGVRPSLTTISKDPQKFVAVSKNLAEAFHGQHQNVAAKKGAFIVAILSGLENPAFALIKFDDLRVLRFRQETNASGSVKAIVSEIDNTFQEDKKAMQKSALIILNDNGGELAVFDRANRQNISDYFKNFLGVRRVYTPETASQRLKKALSSAFSEHTGEASDDVKQTWRARLHSAVQSRTSVLPEDLDIFGASVFGDFWENDGFKKSLQKHLQQQRIAGEAIILHKDTFPKPIVKRVKTKEDIFLRYPVDLEGGIVKIVKHEGGGATITIETQEIVDNELGEQITGRIG
ncbi:nucleoid-associated protein [Agrobacterium rhizogenes]|uniref:nucleoid-associated protein n=1 Tax=Rhizobium rhizogenes TaxID=359 RepID=UPI001572EA47|nr:nucleoid-associated protein [Rhizobium rhizogenes]NTI01922.1 nucleoid-associated protein [Rhizobium rhizogenes]NTI08725.1 nucleoid-associated protein [Rhizobium rhizogenes]